MEHPTLRKGDSGPDVVYLQTLLCDVGETLKADGKFGTQTENAVKDFQRQFGLTVDGVVGPQTWAALESATGHQHDEPDAPQDEQIADDRKMIQISREDWDTICRIVKKYENRE